MRYKKLEIRGVSEACMAFRTFGFDVDKHVGSGSRVLVSVQENSDEHIRNVWIRSVHVTMAQWLYDRYIRAVPNHSRRKGRSFGVFSKSGPHGMQMERSLL